jgi:tyrosyl-tRNA synthetase
MKNVIEILEERGLVEAMTGPELKAAAAKPLRFYVGFDPTAESLHVGNLVGIMVMGWFQKCGHTPFALVGGATGLIGDPSGKSHERPLLTPEQVEINLAGIRRDIEKVLEPGAIYVNNYDWFKGIGLIEFLRDVGKHFRLGPMLGKEMVRTRLQSDEGLSYTEFSYQMLQGYDFLHLFETEGVTLQVGGSDQWGNITAGTELVRKKTGTSVHGLTFPLLTRSDGKKFGKSEGGAIWLSAEKLSPYDFYQYLYRVADVDVCKMMRMLTFLPMDEIRDWERQLAAGECEPHAAQKRLAASVTELVHGDVGLTLALQTTASMAPGAAETELSIEALASAVGLTLPRGEVVDQLLLDLFVATGLCASKGEARRLIRNGGARLNNAKMTDENRILAVSDLIDNELLLLAAGKKKKLVIRLN